MMIRKHGCGKRWEVRCSGGGVEEECVVLQSKSKDGTRPFDSRNPWLVALLPSSPSFNSSSIRLRDAKPRIK